ncbi:pre-mRNA-processing factor 39-like [Anomaloglossus baeobatrachus]|uniref:pre-mRNA-processing factor 39-like n=1 Tax=Anomaloglossus baeobatrachus TaxID=238106 RepID=UPI003F5077C3
MAETSRLQSGACTAGSLPSTSQSSQDCDVLTTEDCSGSEDEEDSKGPDTVVMSPDLSTYWKAAVNKPNDFNAWGKLIAFAEKEKNLESCRKSYDAFLTCFPLSHIFWKKYADLEQNHGNTEEAEKIFIRAVKANPLNVTLWTSYILFLLKNVNENLPNSAEGIRRVFNEAIELCGMEYYSDDLWNLYIDHEVKHNNFREAMQLLNRILKIPTQRYQVHFERLKLLITSHSPVELLSLEELSVMCSKVQVENDQVAVEDSPLEEVAVSLSESDVQKIRQLMLYTMEQTHLLNKVQVQERYAFEENIKRLYFVPLPLNVKQLQNWKKYLMFEMSRGQHDRIVVLFERCLMPCVMYEEFWLMYTQYMEGQSVEAARTVFERACRTHLPLKFTLHLQWAFFEEKHGELDSARAILRNLEKVLPGVVLVRLRLVNFERRNGNLDEAERLLRESAQNSSSPDMAAFYTIKLARLLLKLKNDPEKARDLLMEAIKKEPTSPYLHQCLLEIEISRDCVDDVIKCVQRAMNSNIEDTIKGTLSLKRLEYLEDNGTCVKSLLNAYDEHRTLLKQKELKRKENAGGEGDESNKKAKTESSDPSVKVNISTPEVPKPAVSPVASSTTNTSTTESATQKTEGLTFTKPVQSKPQQTPTAKDYAPRPLIQPDFPPQAPQPVSLANNMFRGTNHQQRMHFNPQQRMHFNPQQRMHFNPQQRMHFNPQQRMHFNPYPGMPFNPHQGMPFNPHYMSGPPQNYGPWFQNFGGYNNPPPWNYNRFNSPF